MRDMTASKNINYIHLTLQEITQILKLQRQVLFFLKGNNNNVANAFLKTDYTPDCSLEKGIELAIKAVLKTMDTTNPKPC